MATGPLPRIPHNVARSLKNPSKSIQLSRMVILNTTKYQLNRWAIWLICFNCLNWTTYFQVSLVYFGVHWVVTIFTSGGGGGEEDCLYVGVPPRLPPPPWSTAPITIPSSHTWTPRWVIFDNKHRYLLTEISLPDVSNPYLAYYGRLFPIPTLAECWCQMLT